jgi:sulfide dehydrogenase [flavocytochrome c] flavoprotein chain
MNTINRRDFIKLMGITTAAVATPTLGRAAGGSMAPQVVVVGHGFAGSTVAKYLRMWSNQSIDVTVVDPNASHVSCVMSNLVVNGRLGLSDITFEHALLQQQYGVQFIQDTVIGVENNSVLLASGGEPLAYDYLVLAPGIGFEIDDYADLDFAQTPHAWIAGEQTTILKQQLDAVSAGGTVVMTVPKAPYRCPPGPYERACVIADMMKRKGAEGQGGKVVVLDMNPKIIVEEHMFSTAFNGIYGNIIQYIPNVTSIDDVHSASKTITFTENGVSQQLNADVLNFIPVQKAGKIIEDLELNTVDDRWADINPVSYELNAGGDIFVIGDSSGGANVSKQPKSGHMANSQAKVCADAIIRKIAGQDLYATERISNITTNSACYSPITLNTATWLTAGFYYDIGLGKMLPVQASLGQAELHSNDHYEDMFEWSGALLSDTFM